MDVPFLHLLFTLEQSRPAANPYALFGLKKLFPAAFRKMNRCADGNGECSAGADCPCRLTFAQELSADPSAVRRYQKPPLPFAFQMPLPAGPDRNEEELGLVIVGAATRYPELYIKSVQHLCGRNSSFGLGIQCREVSAVAADGSRQLLGDGSGRLDLAALPFRAFSEVESAPVSNAGSLSLELCTPLRLIQNGRPLRSPLFADLAGSLFRRVSALAYYYGGIELDHDFKWLTAQSRVINSMSQLEWAHWSGVQQGCIGKICFSGELEEFLPFLRLGELLNVGKGAAYGMGRYTLSWN